MSKMIPIS